MVIVRLNYINLVDFFDISTYTIVIIDQLRSNIMAKHNITHSCGHQVTHNLIGKLNDRDHKAAWLTNHVCSECYKVQLAVAAAEAAKEQQLPALIGSDKQVAWATTIRQEILESIKQEVLRITKKPIEEAPDSGKAFFNWLKDQKESKFWIDNRMYKDPEYYARLFVAANP